MDDYYSVLGCDKGASKEQIRQQYKKLALQMHPDKIKSGSNSCKDFNLLNKAVSTLTDEKERHKYDTSLLKKRSCNKIVNDEVSIDEFTFDDDGQFYFYDCRCAGQFVLGQGFPYQLAIDSDQQSLVDCNSCSLSILVTK